MISSKKKVFATMGTVLMLLLVVFSAGCISNMTWTFYVDDTVFYQTTTDGKSVFPAPPENPTKDGYYFVGWYYDKGVWEKPVTIASLADLPLASEVFVHAYFTKDVTNYKVTLDSNGGSFVSPVSPKDNGKIPVPENPERPHYTFIGWYTTPNYEDGMKWDFQSDEVTSDITLYAGWKPENEATHYLDGYKQTMLSGVESAYLTDDGKMYITYYLAKVDGAILAVLSESHYNTGGQVLSKSTTSAISDSITEQLEKTISESTGGSKETSKEFNTYLEHTRSVSISAGVKIGEATIGANREHSTTVGAGSTETFSRTESWDTTESITDSESLTTGKSDEVTNDWSLDLEGYPHNYYYQYVTRGDTIITKTYVYDSKTYGKIGSYYDSKIIKSGSSPTNILVYCREGEDFLIPVDERINADMLDIDLNQLFKGDGTVNNPYQIQTADELLMIPLDNTKYYKLTKDVEMGSYSWFDVERYAPIIDRNGYKITYNGSEYPSGDSSGNSGDNLSGDTSDVTEIWTPDQFMNIMYNPSGNYILMADIDLTGITLPEDVHFSGVLDGNNKKITGNNQQLNLNKHNSAETTKGRSIIFGKEDFGNDKSFGLFAKNSGKIKDLILSNFRIIGKENHDSKFVVNVGALAGENYGTISNVRLENCWIECYRTNSCIGAVAGKNSGSIVDCDITQCYVYGNGDAGGVVGLNDGEITSCRLVGGGSDHNRFLYVNKRANVESSHGGVVGEATVNSRITDVSVKDALIVTRYHRKNIDVQVNAGYIAGTNAGKIEGISISNVEHKLRNHDNDYVSNSKISSIAPAAVHTYFPGNGYVGYQTETGNLIL